MMGAVAGIVVGSVVGSVVGVVVVSVVGTVVGSEVTSVVTSTVGSDVASELITMSVEGVSGVVVSVTGAMRQPKKKMTNAIMPRRIFFFGMKRLKKF